MALRLIMILVLALTGCTPRGGVTVLRDDWTGFTAMATADHEIYRTADAVMTARPVMVTRDGQRAYGILTNLRRTGPNGPIIEKIESNGKSLRYQRHDRLLTHCASGCQRAETGVIRLTDAEFRAAAQTGLPLRVFGRRGRYYGTGPATALRAVLDRTLAVPDG